jgi:hypothetical protein
MGEGVKVWRREPRRGGVGELDAARRRAAELEERLRQASPRPKRGAAWCGNEVVASGLYAALDTHLLRGGAGTAAAAIQPAEHGFGDSADPCIVGAAADDADCHICMPRCHGSWVYTRLDL